MAARVYHWKHGWIPLDHVAAKEKYGEAGAEKRGFSEHVDGMVKDAAASKHTSPSAQVLDRYERVDASNPFNAPDVSKKNRKDFAEQGKVEADIANLVDGWTGGGYMIPQIRKDIANGGHKDVVDAARNGVKAPTLYRGMKSYDEPTEQFFRNMGPGDELDLGGLSSVSESEKWADGFSSGQKSGALIEIQGARGLNVRNISNSPHEDEWLLTGKLKVVEITSSEAGQGGTRQMKVVAKWLPE